MSKEEDAEVGRLVMGLEVVGWGTCVNADGSPSVYADTEPSEWTCPAWRGPVYKAMEDLWADKPDDPLNMKINGVSSFALLPVPAYTTDPAADYSVLVKVRETWGGKDSVQFGYELEAIWDGRGGDSKSMFIPVAYRPGDYSKAALAVLKAQKESEAKA